MASRAEQRDELLYALGRFLAPIERLISSDHDVSSEIPFVRAQHTMDWGPLTEIVHSYCKVGALEFGREYSTIIAHVRGIESIFDLMSIKSKGECQIFFDERLADVKRAIRAVPCEFDPTMLSAGSPFQAYRQLRVIFSGVAKRVDLFDPWLGADVYYRYLAEVPLGVNVVVVTTSKRLTGSEGNRLVSVSESFSMERPSHYRLLESSSLHDRHIRCDDQVFHVGGSLKDAGKKDTYTITLAESRGTIQAELDHILATSNEWFGLNTPIHRK